jgi:hypothetical protein
MRSPVSDHGGGNEDVLTCLIVEGANPYALMALGGSNPEGSNRARLPSDAELPELFRNRLCVESRIRANFSNTATEPAAQQCTQGHAIGVTY